MGHDRATGALHARAGCDHLRDRQRGRRRRRLVARPRSPKGRARETARLLSEIGTVRQIFPDAESLMCLAGVSPVSYQSGQIRKAYIRWACNRVLRCTVHLWVDESRKTCQWAQAYYGSKRDAGHSHASALRCLGKRWLKVLWRLWQNHTPYEEGKHLQSLQEHGSFVWPILQNNPLRRGSSL